MIRYDALADATLAHGRCRRSSRSLKSITLGGAVAGVGIEASSFRRGLVHDTVAALEMLTGDGRIVTATPDNEHRDLFFGFPNSYGTLGYALAVTARLVPVKPFVALAHVRYASAAACFAELRAALRRRGARLSRRHRLRAGRDLPDARALRRPGAARPAITRSSASTTGRSASAARTSSRPATTCGAGTPTGSGARRTSARSIRWCAGCSAASGSIRSPGSGSCAGTAAGASRAPGTGCAGVIPNR